MSYNSFYRDLLNQSGDAPLDYEAFIRDIYLAILKPGDWALDAGAHLGVHTFHMAQAIAPDGRVIAIEPVPALVEQLIKDLKTHHGHVESLIEIHNCGVSNSVRIVPFYFAPDVPGLSGLRRRDILSSHKVRSFDVRLNTIDRICSQATGNIRFIKIDIEGAEYDALRGAEATIRRHQPVITFEHALGTPADFGYSIDELLAMWSGLGYNVYDFFGNSFDRVEPWADSMTGDFVAFPRSFTDPQRIFEAVQRTLRSTGVNYSIASFV